MFLEGLYSSGQHTITTTSNVTTSGGSSPIDHKFAPSSPHDQVILLSGWSSPKEFTGIFPKGGGVKHVNMFKGPNQFLCLFKSNG